MPDRKKQPDYKRMFARAEVGPRNGAVFARDVSPVASTVSGKAGELLDVLDRMDEEYAQAAELAEEEKIFAAAVFAVAQEVIEHEGSEMNTIDDGVLKTMPRGTLVRVIASHLAKMPSCKSVNIQALLNKISEAVRQLKESRLIGRVGANYYITPPAQQHHHQT